MPAARGLLTDTAMRSAAAIALGLAWLVSGPPALAETGPLPLDDSRAGMCDAYDGAAFTFCVALCEARLCDLRSAADARCAVLARGFARATRGALAPCLGGATAGSGTQRSL